MIPRLKAWNGINNMSTALDPTEANQHSRTGYSPRWKDLDKTPVICLIAFLVACSLGLVNLGVIFHSREALDAECIFEHKIRILDKESRILNFAEMTA